MKSRREGTYSEGCFHIREELLIEIRFKPGEELVLFGLGPKQWLSLGIFAD